MDEWRAQKASGVIDKQGRDPSVGQYHEQQRCALHRALAARALEAQEGRRCVRERACAFFDVAGLVAFDTSLFKANIT